MRSDIRDLIAHEAGHLPQPQQWRDAWGDDSNLFKEGGAEFLRWSVAASLGWKDHAVLAAELENAVNNCIIAAAGNSWQHVARRQWGRTPYDCGLAFHAIGLASRAGTQPAAIALRDYYRDAQERGSADFAQALECGRQAD